MANSSSDDGSKYLKASDNTSSEDLPLSSPNLFLNDEMGVDQDIQNVNPLADKLGTSSSESMANSSSDKGSSEDVKVSDNTSNEDSSLSLVNLCLNNENGMDQDIQNVNPPANELGGSYSGSMVISSSDKCSSENVKASDNTSNEDSSLSLANLCLNDEKGMDQDIQNVNPPANELGSSYSGSMANSSSDKGYSENVKASDNSSNEDLSLSLANVSLNDEMGMDQEIQKVNPPANELGSSSSGVEDSSIFSTAASDNNPFTEDLSLISSQKPCLKNDTSEEQIQKVPSSVETQQFDNNEDDNNEGEFLQLDPNPNVEGTSYISLPMTEEGSQRLMISLDNPESIIPIFKETLNCLFELMTDEYGRQVFMKLIDMLDNHIIEGVLGLLNRSQLLISASLHEYGPISVLKLIEVLQKTPSIRKLTTVLANGNYTLLTHETGKHVVLKCFSILDFDDYEPLYEAIRRQCVDIAWHEVGCISLCACLDLIKNPHRDRLLNGVLLQSTFLGSNSFGLHFLEYVIRLEDPGLTSTFRSNFTGYRYLSMTREGSEFVRTCLRSTAMRRTVVEELVKSKVIEDVARDKFGTHVVQLALLLTMENELELYWLLIETLEPYMQILRYHPTGRVVYSSIQSENFFDKDERMR